MGMIELLLIIVILVALFGSYPGAWGWSSNWGYGPFGAIVFILLIVILLKVLGVHL